jgi:hypothetical protein
VSPVKYELRFYIPEDGILHSHRREHLKSYMDGVLLALYEDTREALLGGIQKEGSNQVTLP